MRYSKKIMKYFRNPKNMGKIKNPDAVGKAGNPICGDVMEFYLKIKNNKIKDVKFQTLGCAVAIAVSSILTEIIKGKTLEEAEKIDVKEIIKKVGKIPQMKLHCCFLAREALKKAIKNYKKLSKG